MLIGLTGFARSGKDSAANIVLQWAGRVGVNARKQGFADYLKLSLLRLFDPYASMEEALIWADNFKLEGEISLSGPVQAFTGQRPERVISGRTALQRYGTECHREIFDEDFWIDPVLDHYQADQELLIVPDIRFPNEAIAVLAHGGVIWCLHRQNAMTESDHASESGLADHWITEHIGNNGSLLDLEVNVLHRLSITPGYTQLLRATQLTEQEIV